MPVPQVGGFYPMADRKKKLARVNAHKNIPYRPSRDGSDSDSDLSTREDISEEDLMLYGVGNVESFQRMCEKIGLLSITPDEWESGRSRHGFSAATTPRSPPLDTGLPSFKSSPSRSPASPVPRVHADSPSGRYGSSHGRSSPVVGSPAAPPSYEPVAARGHRDSPSGTYRLSWSGNSHNVEAPATSTSYGQTVRPRRLSKSGELNPPWMDEGKLEAFNSREFSGLRGTPPREAQSPQTPGFKTYKAPWPSEILPDPRRLSPSPDRGSRISTRDYGLQHAVSGPPFLSIVSPEVREPAAKEIVLSPPRSFGDYGSYERVQSAPLALSSASQRHNDTPARSLVEPQSTLQLDTATSISPEARSTSMPANLDKGGVMPAGSGLSADESTLTTEENDDDSTSTDVGDGLGTAQPRTPWRYWMKLDVVLGRGSFGTVYEAVSSDGTYFAVKEVPLDIDSSQSITQLEQEIALLSRFKHENIVQYYGTERTDQALYIFLEYVTKGSLVSLYKKYKLFVEQIQSYTRQILRGLKYLHDQNIVHRDVKCANILIDTLGMAKLADFGMAKQISKLEELQSCKGSANWMAPEVINPRKQYHLPADIWSLGCTVLEMATGAPPFANIEWPKVFWKVAHGESPAIPEDLNEDLQDFIRQCFEVEPSKRPTAADLLKHPFLHTEYSDPPSPSSTVSKNSRGSQSLNAIPGDMFPSEPNGETGF